VNVVVKQREIDSQSYEVKVSTISNGQRAFLGFVVSLRKSNRDSEKPNHLPSDKQK
jgi:hypothetical protein